MYLQINEIPDDGLRLERSFELNEVATDHEGRLFPKPVAFHGELRTDSGRLTLSGKLTGTARLCCSRCLDCFDEEISGRFKLTIRTSTDRIAAGERRMRPSDALAVVADAGRLDLESVFREQCHLLLPLKPLCRPDCRGLCPTCGSDRNRIECACSSAQVDPRLAELAEFRRNMPGTVTTERRPGTDNSSGAASRSEGNDGESKA